MNLKEYLFKENIKYNAFAEELNISYRTLWGIIHYNHDMKLSLALKIQKLTNGHVTTEDLYDIDLDEKKPKSKQKKKQ